MKTQNIGWTVSLSNGETHHENKGGYTRIAGQPAPWLRLLRHMEENNLSITSLGLYTDAGHRWNLPSKGRIPLEEFAAKTKDQTWKYVAVCDEKGIGKPILIEGDAFLFAKNLVTESVTGFVFYDVLGKTRYVPISYKNPRFAAFYSYGNVKDLRFFRKEAADKHLTGAVVDGSVETFAIAEAEYENGTKLQIWVNSKHPDISWSLIT
jgi:hypothetical protein